MSHELLQLLLALTLASSGAALLALGLRRPVRLWLGAATSCSLWLLMPAAMLAVLLPHAHATIITPAGPLLQQLQGNRRFHKEGLPETLSVVIYNGALPWKHPTQIGALLRNAIPALFKDRLVHQYRLIDEAARVADGPLPGDNLAAALFTLEHPGTVDNLLRVLQWLNGKLVGSEHARLRRDFGRLAYWLSGTSKIRLRLPWKRDLLQEVLQMGELQGRPPWAAGRGAGSCPSFC